MLQANLIKLLIDTRVRVAVLLVLLPLLAYQSSILFWQFYPKPTLSDNAGARSLVRSDDSVGKRRSYLENAHAISRSFLFGELVTEVAVVDRVEEAPETKLKYKLRGIYFSEQPDLASAIVELKPKLSQNFRAGDEMEENITVSSIARDHILIDRYGKIERLNLEKPTVLASSTAVASRLGGGSSLASTKLLKSYKRRYVSNPLALAKRFQATPVQENGKNIGFRLKGLRGESLLKKLKFNQNDVFTRINGISLGKPFQALDALKSLTTASSVSVTVLRNGNEETMDFNL